MKEKIFANAALVRSVAAEQLGVVVGYDARGVQWLDRYIDGQHAQATPEVKEKLVHTLGSFLGECIRQTYGGQWVVEPESPYWFIRFSDDNAAYPFSKVSKQLRHGADESVLGFFVAIGAMGLTGPKAAAQAAKPWWRPW
ncbi:hypothetical protein [Massilia glaciei]|uniref:Uncharacterized protein n=1 Tax=Massilia glaciei TaxID=1524097 RepID=A0A2U2HI35_9BURK|nr:hypothetical protein [Massilia glaciei]PWF45993.1 hypothetical protein C7C56_016870 [Massilia glaciei]